eukprot:TRINITY_DN115030_c0_g1_i1.p1 TRINITY_DN115030_c0_g1~~TRINITY_DN115030_c0_g1_i1.p1  ORF type:complete len:520 (+),score=126.38 TRINITY_DN115030_c0_g1_i1:33-1562(+)
MQAIKITYNGVIRRVGKEYFEKEWLPFCNQLRELFREDLPGLEDGVAYRLSYFDDDGDAVTIASTPELQEAFASCKQSTLRFALLGKDSSRSGGVTATLRAVGDTVQQQVDKISNSEAVQLLQQGDIEGAVAILERSIAQQAESAPTVWYNLACAKSKTGDIPGAIAALETSIQNGYTKLAHMMEDTDLDPVKRAPQFLDTLKALLQQLKQNTQSAADVCNATLVTVMQKNMEFAQTLSQAAAEVFPNDPVLCYNASCLESLKGNIQAAANYMKQAIINGYNDAAHFSQDPDLKALRDHPVVTEIHAAFNQAAAEATKVGADIKATVFPPPVESQQHQDNQKSLLQAVKEEAAVVGASVKGGAASVTRELQAVGRELYNMLPTSLVGGTVATPQQPTTTAAPTTAVAPTVPTPAAAPPVVPSLSLPNNNNDVKVVDLTQEDEVVSVASSTTELVTPTSAPASAPQPQRWAEQIKTLLDMGFQLDKDVLCKMLDEKKGNVAAVTAILLEQ